MVRGAHLLVVAGLVAAAPALAGPWAREEGGVFLSYALSASTDREALIAGTVDADSHHALYGEYGLGRRLTLGLDAGHDGANGLAVAFLRYTLTDPTAPLQFAVDLGGGLRLAEDGEAFGITRIGLSAGRGLGGEALDWIPVFEPEGGWIAVDATWLSAPGRDWEVWQVEGTFGVNLSERFAGMLQLKVEDWPGSDLAAVLSPSLLVRWNDGATSLQLGGRIGIAGSEEIGLRLGLWQEF